jgi:hypothetical protein
MPDADAEGALKELLRELKQISALLRLGMSDRIGTLVDQHLKRPPSRAVLVALSEAGGELPTATLQERARERGVARSTFFRAVDELEVDGLIERQRRGVLSLADYAARFVRVPTKAETSGKATPDGGVDGASETAE